MVYYKFADLIAGALLFTTSCGSRSSRYVGIPDIKTPTYPLQSSRYFNYFIMFTFIGFIGGIGLGILLTSGKGKKKKKEGFVPPTDQVPRSIQDYYRKQGR